MQIFGGMVSTMAMTIGTLADQAHLKTGAYKPIDRCDDPQTNRETLRRIDTEGWIGDSETQLTSVFTGEIVMIRFVLMLCLIPVSRLSAADADLILHNGRIITVDAKFSICQAVAVKNGRIVATGDNGLVLAAEKSSRTEVIDLAGKTVLPGLIDSHLHPLEAGLSEFRAPLPLLDSFESVREYIRKQAAVVPKGHWIVVPRTFPTRLKEMCMPTRELLDVATEHPVMYDASYVVIINTFALKMCGINRQTPNPPKGEIVHDDKGEPNGILKNAQSLLKGIDAGASFTSQEKLEALARILKLYQAAGLTSIGDGAADADSLALYDRLRSQDRLPVRVALTWWIDIARPLENIIAAIKNSPFTTNSGDDWIKWDAFKINFDGGMTIGTAYQREPYGSFGKQLYGKTDPKDRGQLFADPEKAKAVFRAAREKGWSLSAHCQGGGAIDLFLDALDATNSVKTLNPSRSHWIHASFQSPASIARAREMGVLADVQAAWLYCDAAALEQVFGYDGMRYFFPLRSYIAAGVKIAGGSDHMIGYDKNKSTNPYNPFLGMWIAMTRKTTRGTVIHPEERVTREEALKMYTIWAAFRQFAESARGSIEPGKLADMVVIDRDYLTCPEDQIKEIAPLMTILNGRIAYRK